MLFLRFSASNRVSRAGSDASKHFSAKGAAQKNREKIEGRFAAGGRAAIEVLAIVRLHGIMNTVIGHGFAGR